MQDKKQEKAKLRVVAIARFSRAVLLFSLMYLLTFLVTLYFYMVYWSVTYKFDEAVKLEKFDVAKQMINSVLQAYWDYNLSLVIANVILVFVLIYLLVALSRIQILFRWEKSVRTTKLIIILLVAISITSYVLIGWFSYTNMSILREYLEKYVYDPTVGYPQNSYLVYLQYLYVLSYFIMGIALFYSLHASVKILENFRVLREYTKKVKWFMYASFFYFLELYLPIKLTWFLFPILAYLVYRESQKLISS